MLSSFLGLGSKQAHSGLSGKAAARSYSLQSAQGGPLLPTYSPAQRVAVYITPWDACPWLILTLWLEWM